MIRRAPPAASGRYAFTGPPPATQQAVLDMGHRAAWIRVHHNNLKMGVRKWAQLLAAIGYPIDHMTVHRYEKAQLLMPANYLWVVSKLSGADPGWLLTGKGKEPKGYSRDWEAGQNAAESEAEFGEQPAPKTEAPATEEMEAEVLEDYATRYPRRKPRGPRKRG